MNYFLYQILSKDIYPASLEMERSGNNDNVNYLDLNIYITPDGLSVSVYNKKDDFYFMLSP